MPKVLETSTGPIRSVPYGREMVDTGIFKSPVSGPLRVHKLSIEGDRQADLRVHGGVNKAVYLYPSEHFPAWREDLPEHTFEANMFGENLLTEGLWEEDLRVGDRLRIGTTLLEITQPRQPCFKLGIRFGRKDVIKMFRASGRSGFYARVLEEGTLQAGDNITWTPVATPSVSIKELNEMMRGERKDRELFERALQAPGLPEGWVADIREALKSLP